VKTSSQITYFLLPSQVFRTLTLKRSVFFPSPDRILRLVRESAGPARSRSARRPVNVFHLLHVGFRFHKAEDHVEAAVGDRARSPHPLVDPARTPCPRFELGGAAFGWTAICRKQLEQRRARKADRGKAYRPQRPSARPRTRLHLGTGRPPAPHCPLRLAPLADVVVLPTSPARRRTPALRDIPSSLKSARVIPGEAHLSIFAFLASGRPSFARIGIAFLEAELVVPRDHVGQHTVPAG